MFNLDSFVSRCVTKRDKSMFLQDIEINRKILKESIEGKTTLVIGGAGTIGSSFIKAILPFRPSELIVVDINENALAELTRDLRSQKGTEIPKIFITYPMDYASSTFERMFRNHKGFNIVANFSAHKHVRSEKDVFSIESMLNNNIINLKNLLDILLEYPPEEYFCVSTDKAANPVNIMGASKRIMEDLIFSYSDEFPVKTARFANVAFSNGSLPDSFLSRINKLQPISAPNDVNRYFVSIEESGQICLLACMLGKNREIFFPKFKENQTMAFDVIAEELLKEYGYNAIKCDSEEEAIAKAERLSRGVKDYPVYFSKSNTSGEKKYEEFFSYDESVSLSEYKALGIVKNKSVPCKEELFILFNNLKKAFSKEETNKNEIVNIIKEYLGNFDHIETGKSLDGKM